MKEVSSKVLFIIFNIGINNPTLKTIPTGKYFIAFLDKFICLDSSIIIANKNKIAIAPTYTTINNNAKNSHSNKNNKKDENIKQETKNNKENTECCDIITITALKIKATEKI
jgi:hypothetical protein